jgi:glycosyltransferase involved in cell wall biosynthesis
MKASLADSYPEIKSRIHIISQPPPNWLISAQLKRTKFHSGIESGLRLFYPAACYPHKNHRLLSEVRRSETWPVAELILTIPESLNPNSAVPWVKCVDKLEPDAMVDAYRTSDALLCLSFSESYGFPLVEAMWIGLPIICPDLPYARTLCGEQAIYFDQDNISSLHEAVVELKNRRDSGWWPNWSANIEKILPDWNKVADAMIQVAISEKQPD